MDLKCLLLVTVLFVCTSAAPTVREEDREFITSLLEEVSESERKQFVIHQLYKGYILNHPDDIAISIPEESTKKLYDLFLRDFIITPVDTEAFDQLCFPSGECVDTDDPGAYP